MYCGLLQVHISINYIYKVYHILFMKPHFFFLVFQITIAWTTVCLYLISFETIILAKVSLGRQCYNKRISRCGVGLETNKWTKLAVGAAHTNIVNREICQVWPAKDSFSNFFFHCVQMCHYLCLKLVAEPTNQTSTKNNRGLREINIIIEYYKEIAITIRGYREIILNKLCAPC